MRLQGVSGKDVGKDESAGKDFRIAAGEPGATFQ
jgi:hypothetical protein